MTVKTRERLTWIQADEILNVDDVADLLNLGKNQVYQLVRREDFPVIRFGRQYRISKAGLSDWIKNNIQKA